MIEIDAAAVPFAVARALARTWAPTDAGVLAALRPVTHDAPRTSRVKTQLRFHTRERALRGFRVLGWWLAARDEPLLDVRVRGEVGRADHELLAVVARFVPVRCAWEHAVVAPSAAEDVRVAAEARDPGAAAIARHVSCGDPWTAAWLADAALRGDRPVRGAVADAAALAFMLMGRTADAERMYGDVGGGPLERARSGYGVAMLYARHHPRSLRDAATARRLVDDAAVELATAPPSDERTLEHALNRNALALLLHRDGEPGAAADVLTGALASLAGSDQDQARAILCHNLGRVLAATGDTAAAEAALLRATTLDPGFAEYWLDLGDLLARDDRLDAAAGAARRAAALAPDLAEAHALLGFVAASTGDHAVAADAYGTAAALHPGRQEHLLAAARESCCADDHATARRWLDRLWHDDLSPDERAEAALLDLEVASHVGPSPLPPAAVVARVCELAVEFPSSELVRANLDALAGHSRRC